MKRLIPFIIGLLLIAGQVSADITTGLVSYWPLTSGYKATPTTVLDIVSNNNGTIVDAVVGGESTAFDGTGDWVTFTNSGLNAVGATSITVAVWVYTDPADWDGTYDAYIDNADANINANDGFGLWLSDQGGAYPVEGTLSWIRTGTGLRIEIKSNDNTISSVGWYHIVVTYTAGTGVVYINSADETASAGVGSGNFVPNTDAMYFGARNSGANPFTGSLSDVRIYSRALSSDDVVELYALGQPEMGTPAASGSVGYHATGLTPADSRSSFAAGDSWLAWDALDFSAYGTGNWEVILTDSSGYRARGIAGVVGTGEAFGGEELSTYTTFAPTSDYGTFTTTNEDIDSAIHDGVGYAYAKSDILTLIVGALYKDSATLTLNSGAAPWHAFGDASGNGDEFVDTLNNGVNTNYFVRMTGVVSLMRNSAVTNFSCINDLAQVTEPAATGIHILDGPGGSEAWAEIDLSFDYNDIVEIEILPAATAQGVTLNGVSIQ